MHQDRDIAILMSLPLILPAAFAAIAIICAACAAWHYITMYPDVAVGAIMAVYCAAAWLLNRRNRRGGRDLCERD